jgi:hypothetical protein
MTHVCNYYCEGEVHCLPTLARADCTLEEARAFQQALYGDQFVDIRPAHEAEWAHWTQHPEDWSHDPQAYPVPFLLFVRRPFFTKMGLIQRYLELGYLQAALEIELGPATARALARLQARLQG